jgi:NAD(P)-dependent dehydrogenase (short-subunit alcohol dehydrogenase family)/acyl carrier protein
MEWTGGKGVDIVLNSLSGPAIARSLSILSPYGRFVEIGKRDIYENSKLGMRPFRNNLSFFAVDLDRLCVDQPDFVRSLLQEVMEGFSSGKLYPLAHRCFSISDVTNAFRFMAQAKHIGKVVVSLDYARLKVAPTSPRALAFRPDGTYLITGGLGGFGLAAASWMAEHGARNLVLVGRRGASTPEAKAAIKKLHQAGVHVVVEAADVAEERQVVSLITTIRSSMPPLRGVIHAAMVLDDGLLQNLDRVRFNTAMAPKVLGAWNLHIQTLSDPLDLFVCFSSFTSMFGNPGQGNYVAANAFLDALAHHRRAQRLPALTVNWGAVADAGYVARNVETAEKLERVGVGSMPVQKTLDILGQLIRYEGVQVGVAQINWQKLAKLQLMGSTARFAHLIETTTSADSEGLGIHLLSALMAVTPDGRQEFLVKHISTQLARVLGSSPEKLDTEQPLLNMGLDSLMALEIGNQIQSDVGVKIPPMKFMEGLSISGLARLVIEKLTKEQADSSQSSKPSSAVEDTLAASEGDLEEQVESLSDERVDAMLGELLEEKVRIAETGE